jgi:signal transduction histidine kinase
MQGELEALLTRTDITPAVESKLLSLQEEIARLNRITEHLLLLARFDTGRAAAIREPVDLSDLVREACEDAEMLASAHQVLLAVSVTPGVRVNGDPRQLRRVLLNLLDNACKFNVPGGLVRCSLERLGDAAHLTVANTGPGVVPEMRPRLFERFFRADPSRARAGHGLGLSLCREIIQAHGGQITLTDGPTDAPTAFAFTLPADPG